VLNTVSHIVLDVSPAPGSSGGGKKNDAAKLGVHLLPPGPLCEIAKVLDFGAKKYDPWNWSKGMAWSRLYAAMLRHLWAWWRGETLDPETGLNHLAHVGCSVLFLLQYAASGLGTDDRPIQELKENGTKNNP
jgi:hypothetical protein